MQTFQVPDVEVLADWRQNLEKGDEKTLVALLLLRTPNLWSLTIRVGTLQSRDTWMSLSLAASAMYDQANLPNLKYLQVDAS